MTHVEQLHTAKDGKNRDFGGEAAHAFFAEADFLVTPNGMNARPEKVISMATNLFGLNQLTSSELFLFGGRSGEDKNAEEENE